MNNWRNSQRSASRAAAIALVGTVLAIACFPVSGQIYPNRTVRIVVPYAPGGGTDVAARVLAQSLGDALGQSVITENKAGAGGTIGIEMVAKSAADGYTLVVTGSGAITLSGHLRKLPYDSERDLAPISMLATVPLLIAVHPSLPVTNIKELIDYAKARPGALNYASSGIGTISSLSVELFKSVTGINMVHVPYSGAAPGAAALVANDVQVAFVDAGALIPFAKAGRVRPIAVTDANRASFLPDVPTVGESGVPNYAVSTWVAMFAPAGTPPAVIERLNAEVTRALQQPQVREKILGAQMEPSPGSTQDLARTVNSESAKWAQLVKATGMKVD